MSIRIIEKSEECESELVNVNLIDAGLPIAFEECADEGLDFRSRLSKSDSRQSYADDAWEYDPSLEAPLTDEEIFSRSLIGMSVFLGLQQQELAVVLGLSQAQVTRISSRRYVLSPQKAKEWEIACVFARLHDGLVARFDGDRVATLRWLNFYCAELGDRPVVLIQSFEGLLRCVNFVENN